MDPSRYVAAIFRRWFIVVLIGVLGLGATALLTLNSSSQYRATTSLFFSVTGASSVSDLTQSATYTQNLMQSFGALATSAAVLDPVNQSLGVHLSDSKLAGMVHVKSPAGTAVLQISVVDSSASQAASLANAIAAQLSKNVTTLSPAVTSSGNKQLSATIVAPAPVPRDPIAKSKHVKSLLEGGVAGLILGACLILLRELIDNRVRNEDDLRRVSGAPLLGRVDGTRRPLLIGDTTGRGAESYRALRTTLFAALGSGHRSFVVASSRQGEGSTTVAINLALLAAETGASVLLVEADLRHPTMAKDLGLPNGRGLPAVVANPNTLSSAAQALPGTKVQVLTAGGTPPNPGELISSHEMASLIEKFRADYDVVVIDASALLGATDAAVLARYTDGALVVIDARKTTRLELAKSTAALHRAGAVLLGVVLNRTDRKTNPWSSQSAPTDRPAAKAGSSKPAPAKGKPVKGKAAAESRQVSGP